MAGQPIDGTEKKVSDYAHGRQADPAFQTSAAARACLNQPVRS